MNYIKIENGKIKGSFCSNEIPQGATEIPENANVRVGDDVAFYNVDWTRKTEIELVNEKLVPLKNGFKIDGDKIVEMTEVEKINAGFKELPKGKKIVDGELVEKTDKEKFDDKDITSEDYAEIIRNERDGAIYSVENSNDYKKNLRNAQFDNIESIKYLEDVERYIQYLRDIPNTKNFPTSFTEVVSFENFLLTTT